MRTSAREVSPIISPNIRNIALTVSSAPVGIAWYLATVRPICCNGVTNSLPRSPHCTTRSGRNRATASTLGVKSDPTMMLLAMSNTSGKRPPMNPFANMSRARGWIPTSREGEPCTAIAIAASGAAMATIRLAGPGSTIFCPDKSLNANFPLVPSAEGLVSHPEVPSINAGRRS